jgi:hypothetical protein
MTSMMMFFFQDEKIGLHDFATQCKSDHSQQAA